MSITKNIPKARFAAQRWVRAALVTAPLMALALLTVAPAAQADGYRNGHHYDRGYSRGYDRHNRRYHRGYRGYNRHNFRHSYRQGFRHGRYRRSDRNGAYLLGGLVVGSLITHAIHNNRDDRRYEQRTERYYDPNKSYSATRAAQTTDAPVSRHLFRDAQGNCFERQTGPDNQELLIDLPAEECRW